MSARSRTPWLSLASAAFIVTSLLPGVARATASAELYTSAPSGYGRYEARVRYGAGDGIISSFFLWKAGSDQKGTFWNELDFEKLNADCHLQTNALYGNPVADHSKQESLSFGLCNSYHVYAFEWLPDSIAWLVDGTQIRRETGEVARAYADNAPNGMEVHFNIWPGDASFGGNFNPSVLPVHQYVDWVQFSPYVNGAFAAPKWREDFNAKAVPTGFLTASWASPKNYSKHSPANVNFIDGYAVLSLTADNATGPAGAMPGGGSGIAGASGLGGATGHGGAPGVGGAPGIGGFGGVAAGASGVGSSGAAGAASAASAGAGGTTSTTGGANTGVGSSPSAAGATLGSSGAMNGAAGAGAAAGGGVETSPGCGCTQVGSRGSSAGGLPAAIASLMASIAVVSRRRRSPRP